MLAVERPKRRVMVAADASGISVHARILPREDGSRPSVLRRKMSMIARYSAYHVHVCSVCPLKTKASAQLGRDMHGRWCACAWPQNMHAIKLTQMHTLVICLDVTAPGLTLSAVDPRPHWFISFHMAPLEPPSASRL